MMAAGLHCDRRRPVSLLILSCALCCTIAAPSHAQLHAALVAEAAQRFGLSESLIRSVMAAESAGDAGATSHAGAMGLMQIMPATWSDLSRRHKLGTSPYDPRANILAGTAYLREMIDRYGDLRLALAAYNAGPGRVDAYRKGRRRLPAETIAYVARVIWAREPDGPARIATVPADWRTSALFIGGRADENPPGDGKAVASATSATTSAASSVLAPGEHPATNAPLIIFVRRAGAPAQ